MSAALLHVDECHVYYGDTHVLRGVSLDVGERQVVALVGRNGMGKTTLVRAIMGLNPPRAGSISLGGRPISGLAPEKIARLGVGVVPQGRGVFPSLRVWENLSVVARAGKSSSTALEHAYKRFPRLQERKGSWGDQLSGGEQQMLAFARALVNDPPLLVMDEPLEGLAPSIVKDVLATIREVSRRGVGVLLVEQRLHAALAVADRVEIMGKGVIVFGGTPDELRDNQRLQEAYLGVN